MSIGKVEIIEEGQTVTGDVPEKQDFGNSSF